MIDSGQLAALREHFAVGRAVPGSRPDDACDPDADMAVTLYTLALEIPAAADAAIIATDGSSPESIVPGQRRVCGCAAVAADGRILIGWFDDPGITNRGQYTEWQGARLGLRLAVARYPAGATMITDCREVATELRHVMAGRNPGRVVAADDLTAIAEIRSLIAETRIRVVNRWVAGDDAGYRHRTAGTTIGRAAHVGAWLARRIVADGGDPRQHAEWIAGAMAEPPGNQTSLTKKYIRRFKVA